MEKYDTAWSQDTVRPFIMENDKLMVGYRSNQKEAGADAAASCF